MKIFRKLNLLIVLGCVVLMLAACGGSDEKSEAAANDNSAAQTSSEGGKGGATLPDDPLAAITQALKNQQTAGPYRVKTTIESEGQKMEMSAEIKLPDQMRVISDVSDKKMEMVFVGGKGWMRIDENWMDAPMKIDDLLHQMNAMSSELLTEIASDAAKVGNETVDGQETVLYTYNMDMNKSSTMKMDMKSAVKLWIRTSDNLPIKQEVSGEAMGIKSVSTQVIEYDPTITIEAPVK